MIRFGVIGSGWIAEEFVKGANLVDGMEFSAMYSRTYEVGKAFSSKFSDVPVYTDIEAFAKSDIDAVYIASPNFLHYEQSKLMLENGKHVLCEKPITETPEEFAQLTALAESKNLICTEAIMMLHLPARKIVKDAMKTIGNITSAHFDFSQLSSKYEALKRGEIPNIFNPAMNTGCLRDIGIYCFYPAVDFFGMPEKVVSTAGILRTGSDGYGTSILCYADKQITLTYSKLAQDYCGSQINGDLGTITFDSISKLTGVTVHYNDGTEKKLVDSIEKHVLMSYEAKNLYNYINFFESEKNNYLFNNSIINNVCLLMNSVKYDCGIN